MIRKILQGSSLLFIVLFAACGYAGLAANGESVEMQSVIDLVCGTEDQAGCVPKICANEADCPLFAALSDQAVFDFVETYSECDACNTPDFPPDLGIGKCIEYQAAEIPSGWEVTFSVSESCSFRYGSPAESRIIVEISSDPMQIEGMDPPIEYIKDASYCQTAADCYCLSGSGVPLTGCSNLLYAPLNWSGYYRGDDCGCVANQCTEK
jgi:hypothetical protein